MAGAGSYALLIGARFDPGGTPKARGAVDGERGDACRGCGVDNDGGRHSARAEARLAEEETGKARGGAAGTEAGEAWLVRGRGAKRHRDARPPAMDAGATENRRPVGGEAAEAEADKAHAVQMIEHAGGDMRSGARAPCEWYPSCARGLDGGSNGASAMDRQAMDGR